MLKQIATLGVLLIFSALFVSGASAAVPDNYAAFTTTLTIANGKTSGTVEIPSAIRGKIEHMYCTAEDLTTDTTYTVRILPSSSPTNYFWISSAIADNGTAEVIGKTNTTVDYAPLPGNSDCYFGIVTATAQGEERTFTITYSLRINFWQYAYNSEDLVIADNGTFKAASIGSTSRLGRIVCMTATIPALTSNANTTFSLSPSSSDDSKYYYISGNVAHNAHGSVFMPSVAGLANEIPIMKNAACYLRAKASAAQTGAKTITVYFIATRDIYE